MSDGPRAFLPRPVDGFVEEIPYELAVRLLTATREGWRPDPIIVIRSGMRCCYMLRTWNGEVGRGSLVTTQARKVAEALVWVHAIHAIARLGFMAMMVMRWDKGPPKSRAEMS